MKPIAILLIIFGTIIIIVPEIVAYLIGGFLVFIGLNMFFVGLAFGRKTKSSENNYVKFGKYKIFR